MLYIFLMPAKVDKTKRLILVNSTSYQLARDLLGLPVGLQNWACITAIELNNLMSAFGQSVSTPINEYGK